jgi:hypothetical protein
VESGSVTQKEMGSCWFGVNFSHIARKGVGRAGEVELWDLSSFACPQLW